MNTSKIVKLIDKRVAIYQQIERYQERIDAFNKELKVLKQNLVAVDKTILEQYSR
jgi:peptidoglycan hydrolase CwlO-like protein